MTAMRINLYDGDTNDLLSADVDLTECFDLASGQEEDYELTLEELTRTGRCYVGGGAAALFLLTATGSAL